MNKIKIGIIGTGGISTFHIDSYLKNPHVEVVAFCDINPQQLEAMSKRYNIDNIYTDVNDMLAQTEMDAVSVCTWNNAHADCTVAALKAGKHVLCEKPMSVSETEALRMEAAARESGKLLQIGFVRRFGNDCTVLKDFIDNDTLGEIYFAKVSYLRRNGNPGGWFGDKSRSGGGPLIDLGVHVIDLARYLMGNPKPVSVYGATFEKLFNRPGVKGKGGYLSTGISEKDICNVEDLAIATIRFENGAVISVETSFSLNIERDTGTIELFGTKGGAKLDPSLRIFNETNGYLTNLSLDMSTELSFDGLFENEVNHFVDCILNETTCRAPANDGVALMKILDAIYRSAETGHEVVL